MNFIIERLYHQSEYMTTLKLINPIYNENHDDNFSKYVLCIRYI